MTQLQVLREVEMLKLANREQSSLDAVKAQLAAVGIRERAKQDMQAAEMQLKAQTGTGI